MDQEFLFTKEQEMKSTVYWQDFEAICMAEQELMKNNVVLCTTDTILGLLAACTQEGFDKLNRIKGRQEKPYLVLIGSEKTLNTLIDQQRRLHIENYVRKCWPGPLTIIVNALPHVPEWMKSKQGAIAVRMPDHHGLQQLLLQCEMLFSTSANFAGKPVPEAIEAVDQQLLTEISLVVLDKTGDVRPSVPSTIIDCTGPEVRLVRGGAYPFEQVQKLWQRK